MELCKEYKTLNQSTDKDIMCEGFEVEYQENLPQYLDDIERIIKCSVRNNVIDYECSSGAVKLYGKSIISLTYVNCDGCLLSNIFEEEFTKTFDTNSNEDIRFARISLNTKYSNYRLVNQRRIDIHSSLKACITVFYHNDNQCLANCENAFVKEYTPNCLIHKNAGICSEEFDEIFSISNTGSQIKNIINTYSSCYIEDKKIIKDKMLIKTRVEISVLYENDNSVIDKCSYSFSLSKIIDSGNSSEDDKLFVTAAVSGIYVKTKTDSNNNLCNIEVVGKVTFNYQLYSTSENQYIIDSYMPDYNTELQHSSIRIKSNPIFYYDDKTLELSFDNEKNIVEILDINAYIVDAKIMDSSIALTVRLSYLYHDEASTLCYFDKTITESILLNDVKLFGIGSANIISFDYVIKNANAVMLRLNFEYSAFLYNSEDVSYVTDIIAGDEKSNSNAPQLTLYFAKKNEDVWDIAKHFSTSVSLIMDENDLTSQVIDSQRVLLVPGM
ncbi:MAG: DUF3794 domain-containing protein [Clostridium sp.]|nr:DUF3794 domain-containing protein [Clostridium sp.]